MEQPRVRPADGADVPRLADVLTDAFMDDPLSQWLFGGDDGLARRLRISFEAVLRRIYLPKGSSYTTDDLAGAALWAPPGKWKIPVLTQVRLAPTFIRHMPSRSFRRGAQVNTMFQRAHPAEPHWHLSVLGVDPVRQRVGIGGALMRPVLERANAEGVLCYLESSKQENLPYYARHGFEVTREFLAPDGGPQLWTMTRRPQ
jgi:ribosomal protein S18 acetylase RimI-like enzyme